MYGKSQESGLIEIIPSICALAIWGQYPVFSYSGILSLLSSHRAHQLTKDCGAIVDDRDNLSLLIWQETFHFSFLNTVLLSKALPYSNS